MSGCSGSTAATAVASFSIQGFGTDPRSRMSWPGPRRSVVSRTWVVSRAAGTPGSTLTIILLADSARSSSLASRPVACCARSRPRE